MTKLEKRLADTYDRKYCKLVGNGTTAIFLALETQEFREKKIAIPNNVCMNVVLPIYFSNNIPVFLDIEIETLGISLDKIKNNDIDAVIAVHAYGNICNIREIEEYCQKSNIFLIEDAALAQGIKYDNRIIGSFGDVSIMSFGSGKVIDIGHGGAILTDDQNIYNKVCLCIANLKEIQFEDMNEIEKISNEYKRLYNLDFGKTINKYCNEFQALCLSKKVNFLHKFDEKYLKILKTKLDKIDSLISIRQNNYNFFYKKFLGYNYIKVIEAKNGSAHWRFNIFINKYRNELFKYLLDKGYNVSSWYQSVDLLFEDRVFINTPISDWVNDTIINIWVNEDINQEYKDNIANDIISFIEQKYYK